MNLTLFYRLRTLLLIARNCFKRIPLGNGVCIVVPDIRSGNIMEHRLAELQGGALPRPFDFHYEWSVTSY